jgi:hypothetical protein
LRNTAPPVGLFDAAREPNQNASYASQYSSAIFVDSPLQRLHAVEPQRCCGVIVAAILLGERRDALDLTVRLPRRSREFQPPGVAGWMQSPKHTGLAPTGMVAITILVAVLMTDMFAPPFET